MSGAAERRRKVKGYHLGIYIGYQPCTVAPLLAEVREGTPQRFLFCAIGPPPDTEPNGACPLLERPPAHVPVIFAEELKQEIRARHLARLRDTRIDTEPDWYSHANLLQCKVAALLCLVDHRQIVALDDWRLPASSARRHTPSSDGCAKRRRSNARWRILRVSPRGAAGAQAAAIAVHQAPARTDALARRLAAKVHEHGRISKGDARANFIRANFRHLFTAACEAAAEHGWLLIEENHLAPGSVRPA
jgi:hypothetical protein